MMRQYDVRLRSITVERSTMQITAANKSEARQLAVAELRRLNDKLGEVKVMGCTLTTPPARLRKVSGRVSEVVEIMKRVELRVPADTSDEVINDLIWEKAYSHLITEGRESGWDVVRSDGFNITRDEV